MSDGGKGSAPRKQQDHEAYSNNYDVIFNRQKRQKTDEVYAIMDKTGVFVQNEQQKEKDE